MPIQSHQSSPTQSTKGGNVVPPTPQYAVHHSTEIDNGYNFAGAFVSDNLRFSIHQRSKHKAKIVIYLGNQTITMDDENISEPQNNPDITGKKFVVLPPGKTFKGYKFHLSPDNNWLYVDRGGFNRFAVCYLYHRVSRNRMEPVYVNGKRLDNAAIALCAKQVGLQGQVLGGGARTTGFVGWDWLHQRVLFNVEASPYWFDGSKEGVPKVHGVWQVGYSVKTRQMSIQLLQTLQK